MELFAAENASWTNSAKLYRVKSGTVATSEEVLLHRKVNEKTMKEESGTRF